MLTNFLVDILPVSETVADGILVALVALFALFLILSVIWLIASLVKMNNDRYEYYYEDEEDEEGENTPPSVTVADDNAVIAAISAAIAVILQEEATAKGTAYNGFKIVSFKRADKGRSWTQKNK